MTENNFRGFGLFNDVEDATLQAYNRARILINIMEDNQVKTEDGDEGLSMKGLALFAGYFNNIPEGERSIVRDEVAKILEKKGLLNV